jgi:hypothetical protein
MLGMASPLPGMPDDAQELVRQLYRRPMMTSSLMDPSPARMGIPSLDDFLLWLWPLTAAPQRSFRANAMWLQKHLAALQSSGRQAGRLERAASAAQAVVVG